MDITLIIQGESGEGKAKALGLGDEVGRGETFELGGEVHGDLAFWGVEAQEAGATFRDFEVGLDGAGVPLEEARPDGEGGLVETGEFEGDEVVTGRVSEGSLGSVFLAKDGSNVGAGDAELVSDKGVGGTRDAELKDAAALELGEERIVFFFRRDDG